MTGVKSSLVNPGDRFGSLVVVDFSHSDKRWRRHYSVKCDCGTVKTVQGTLLRSGNTKSCGCMAKVRAESRRLPNDRGVINHIILQYKRHARDRAIEWNLDFDEVSALICKPCHYCGVEGGNLKKTKNHPGFRYNGIDRRNSSLPYIAGNVVPCCGRCNIAKGTMEEMEFISWAKRVADQWGAFLTEYRRAA